MTRKIPASGAVCAVVFSALAIVPSSYSQAADPAKPLPASPVTSNEKLTVEDETIVLSPFTVETAEDKDSYKAKSTLAGARVRTDLRDVSSSISVVTSKFLQDTGATDNQSLLTYTTNTEVGGLYGNYSGLGNTNGLKENSSLLNPNGNTRVRGLAAADNTRDYFLSDIPWDAYNVDRVDLQRGANSILFGVGSPAGIVNTQLITPNLRKNEGKVENRIGSFGSVRNSLDINYVFLKDQLAMRIAAVGDDTEFRQRPAYDNKKRIFGALRFDPKLFGDSAHTTIKVNFEHGVVNANRPRDLAPMDQITPYFMSASQNKVGDGTEPVINRKSYDAWQFQFTELTNNGNPGNNMGWNTRLTPASPLGSAWNPWLGASMARLGSSDPVFWYNGNSSSPFRVQQSNLDTKLAIGRPKDSNGNYINSIITDGGIDGYPFAHQVSIVGYNQYSKNAETRAKFLGLTDPFPGAQKNLYKDKSLTDTSIFDFYNKLIDGPNKYEKEGWDAHNVDIAQSFFDNKLSFQFVWDKQSYWSRQAMNMSDTPFISIDVNTNLIDNPVVYGATANTMGDKDQTTNVGRAYIGSSGHYGNSEAFSNREDYRLTGVVDVRASDFLEKSWITKLVGRQLLNVVGERNIRTSESRNFVRYATDANWALQSGESPNITQGFRNVDWISYLSPTMSGRSTASGSNISAITAQQSPYGQVVTRYFDSHWNKATTPTDPNYVDPLAAWTNPFYAGASVQAENPANYVGWRNTTVSILNADKGDIAQLYTDGSKVKNVLDTKGLTWQGYFWDGLVVPTFGYRKDKIKSYSANAPQDPVTGVAGMGYEIEGLASDMSEGVSRSWGGVIHAPDFIRKNLPWKSDISLLYNKSENFAAENRVDFQGNRIKNARGNTEEYGIVLSTLDERISLKLVHYRTKVYDANLGGDPATNALGNNTYWLYLAEAWGAASATTDLIGLSGNDTTGSSWYWDWAGQAGLTGTAAATLTAQELAAAKNWVATMQPQSFYDAYGIPVNVANIQAAAASGTWSQTWSKYIGGGWQPGVIGAVQAAGAGKIRGMYPTGTIDTVSQGYEIELNARPTDNWNITFNASKTDAYRTNLSKELSTFIEATHNRLAGNAGLIRTWWAGDTTGTFQANFDNNVYSAYLLQKEGNGLSASEIRPWAFNLISNYSFSHTLLKGVNVGGGYRWQDAAILGYGIKKQPTQFDPENYAYDLSKPIHGKSEGHVDLWVGYERQLSTKVKWRIQANLHNVGEKVGLTPVSVQPDGTPAAQRIQEGMTWQLTNTLSF